MVTHCISNNHSLFTHWKKALTSGRRSGKIQAVQLETKPRVSGYVHQHADDLAITPKSLTILNIPLLNVYHYVVMYLSPSGSTSSDYPLYTSCALCPRQLWSTAARSLASFLGRSVSKEWSFHSCSHVSHSHFPASAASGVRLEVSIVCRLQVPTSDTMFRDEDFIGKSHKCIGSKQCILRQQGDMTRWVRYKVKQ